MTEKNHIAFYMGALSLPPLSKIPTPKGPDGYTHGVFASFLLKTYFRYLNGVFACLLSILQKLFGRIHVLRLPERTCLLSYGFAVSLLHNIPKVGDQDMKAGDSWLLPSPPAAQKENEAGKLHGVLRLFLKFSKKERLLDYVFAWPKPHTEAFMAGLPVFSSHISEGRELKSGLT